MLDKEELRDVADLLDDGNNGLVEKKKTEEINDPEFAKEMAEYEIEKSLNGTEEPVIEVKEKECTCSEKCENCLDDKDLC